MNRLLIVDDEPAMGAYIARVADGLGYEVLITSTPDTFLEHVRTWNPTHIVMDLKMPNVDGIALLSHLAAEKCAAHILLISGADRGVIEAARRVGLDRGLKMGSVLSKPIRVPELRAALDHLKADDEWLTAATLAEAIERDELFLVYQPKIDLKSQELVGFEALIRWEHPIRGTIPPMEFIPFAETCSLIDRLTHYLANAACRQMKQWRTAGMDVELAINISARNLHDGRLADILDGICQAHDIAPERLVLELTETATMRDAAQMIEVLARLRLKGFRLAIDDFGTGYSSLVQLHRLPFSEIKIDRAFVTDCATSAESGSIIKLVVGLAHALNMTAVAEGVETVDSLKLLAELGCDQAQGYYIGRPMPAAQIAEWLDAYTSGMAKLRRTA
jgi:EAL domain-containing protein (putative c-di-GMP-specific phosphodiesterase class I)/CheY-like chemotaxis protein